MEPPCFFILPPVSKFKIIGWFTKVGDVSPSVKSGEETNMGQSWLDEDSSILDDYLVKLDECLPVCSPRTLNDESGIDMGDDEIIWQTEARSRLPPCGKPCCRLGCVCVEEEMSKPHCGRYECMFQCTCTRRLRSATKSSTTAQSVSPSFEPIGTRKREASVSSTNSIFSNRFFLLSNNHT